jgi:hypothetical protein
MDVSEGFAILALLLLTRWIHFAVPRPGFETTGCAYSCGQ